jgi:hypothetical protein
MPLTSGTRQIFPATSRKGVVGFWHNTEPPTVTRKSDPRQSLVAPEFAGGGKQEGFGDAMQPEAVGQPAEMGDQEGGSDRHQRAGEDLMQRTGTNLRHS